MSYIGPRRALLASAAKPTFAWDFSARLALYPAMSYGNASGQRSYFDGAGTMKFAGVNVPRLDRDPLTGAPLGYLAEIQSTNGVTQSVYNAGTWSSLNVSLAPASAIAPDGTTTALYVTENTASGVHQVSPGNISAATVGQIYATSIFVKNIVGTRWIQLIGANTASYVNFNPSTGAVGNNSGASNIQAQQLVNGWWRISFYSTANTTSGNLRMLFAQSATDTSASFPGDGTSTIAVWGAQIDSAGVGLTSYIPTGGAAATRAQDVLTMPLASLPGWNPSQGGVLVAEYQLNAYSAVGAGITQCPIRISDGTFSNYVMLRANDQATGNSQATMVAAGVAKLAGVPGGTPALRTPDKLAVGWSAGRIQLAQKGVFVDGRAAAGLPTGLTQVEFGMFSNNALGGPIRRVQWYAGPRSDAFVQQVSR
jgi:hypothetical protein